MQSYCLLKNISFKRCDGSVIPAPSVWAGLKTPNINGEDRFLRGGIDEVMLQTQEDSIQGHTHGIDDPGHTHAYDDRFPSLPGLDPAVNGIYGPTATDQSVDRWDQYHRGVSLLSTTKVKVTGVQQARIDSETRPKSFRVVYIMKVF